MIKEPPAPKDGSKTVAGCDGVTEAGVCKEGVAVSCNLASGTLRRTDCKALSKSCVIDADDGATCQTVAPGSGGGGGGSSSTCDTGVTFYGSCGGPSNATATWCDGLTKQTIVWNCANDDMECTVDGCGAGAYCCPLTSAPPPSSECPALGFSGECGGSNGNTARWCSGNTLVERPCTGGQTCQLDVCATGAYCCNP